MSFYLSVAFVNKVRAGKFRLKNFDSRSVQEVESDLLDFRQR